MTDSPIDCYWPGPQVFLLQSCTAAVGPMCITVWGYADPAQDSVSNCMILLWAHSHGLLQPLQMLAFPSSLSAAAPPLWYGIVFCRWYPTTPVAVQTP